MNRLIIKDLKKSYDRVVLDEVNFEFEQGKIYAILGRNGAGKTTFFNCLNRDISFERGTFTLNNPSEERELEFSDLGLVSASPVLPEFLTGYEFLHFFVQLGPKQNNNGPSLDDYFDLIFITEEDRHKLIKSYSYGMKNKLQLLCSLIRKPLIIMLDEPLSSFDIIVSHDIKRLLMEMKKDHIILMSTHLMQLAQDVGDEIVILHNGQLTKADPLRLEEQGFEDYIIEILQEGTA